MIIFFQNGVLVINEDLIPSSLCGYNCNNITLTVLLIFVFSQTSTNMVFHSFRSLERILQGPSVCQFCDITTI